MLPRIYIYIYARNLNSDVPLKYGASFMGRKAREPSSIVANGCVCEGAQLGHYFSQQGGLTSLFGLFNLGRDRRAII